MKFHRPGSTEYENAWELLSEWQAQNTTELVMEGLIHFECEELEVGDSGIWRCPCEEDIATGEQWQYMGTTDKGAHEFRHRAHPLGDSDRGGRLNLRFVDMTDTCSLVG